MLLNDIDVDGDALRAEKLSGRWEIYWIRDKEKKNKVIKACWNGDNEITPKSKKIYIKFLIILYLAFT